MMVKVTMARLLCYWGMTQTRCQLMHTHKLFAPSIYACTVRSKRTKTWVVQSLASSFPVQVRCFGQPVAHTHPHLLSSGEVTPNITKEEYRERRSRLVGRARSREGSLSSITGHLFIFPSACRVYMANDIPYPFRQNSDFLYLCGFQEPNSVLVIQAKDDAGVSADNHTAILFVPKKDPHKELWEGPCSGKEGTVELTGVDSAYNYSDLEGFLYNFCNQHHNFKLWYDFISPVQNKFHRDVMSQMIGQERHGAVETTRKLMHELRVVKSVAEVELMKQSVEIASQAFGSVMRYSQPKIEESHLWAKMDFECRIRGAQFLAYPPVVAGGSRANTIHYTANNQVIADGDLVLMDAGCELHGYSSDLTRTWPVNGKFSPAQRALYEAVLAVHTVCVSLSTPRNSLDEIHRQMLALLGIELQKLGIVSQSAPATDVIRKAQELCPHHVGHYLGMDVHDTEDISRRVKLVPGMVITVEPGIYIQKDDLSVDERFRGIGIRIEDNILITDTTPVNLSEKCPRTVEGIERVVSGARQL
ncbi:xaa-Pro aminopeptidase 3-like [Babylonia areolata]|uniref:xaa-Pro aminopeptidase 3-like n=1 Tax=Babylonia areolata TaxID=304850 RepID=UPI003FCF5B25